MANKPLKSITFPGLSDTYTFAQIDNTLAVAGKAADSKAVGDEIADVKADLTTKADTTGTYENMTAGNAEQLNSSQYAEDKTPYLFRASGGGVDVGTREEDTVVGGSLVFNQVLQNGDFSDCTSGWSAVRGSATASNNVLSYEITELGAGTVQNRIGRNFSSISGHKYLASIQWKPSKAYKLAFRLNVSNVERHSVDMTSGVWNTVGCIFPCTTESESLLFGFNSTTGGSAVGDVEQARNAQLFDLTAMFGSAVADRLYALETATAGAGVALFRSMFPGVYYPYEAGTLKHVGGLVSHDCVGFNQWDGEYTANAWLDDTGSVVNNVQGYNVTDYIPILPNTAYYKSVSGSNRSYYYDADKRMLSQLGANPAQTITTPSGACYARFTVTTANLDGFILNISDPVKNGTYEPYTKHSYPLDSTLTLRGIPKLDASNDIYFDGDTYEADGTVTRRYGVVDLGTLTWTKKTITGGEFKRFEAPLPDAKPTASGGSGAANAISTRYEIITPNKTFLATADGFAIHYNSPSSVLAHIAAYEDVDAEAFKTAMSGVYLVYELDTPTTEEADPYTTPQIVNEYGTEEYVIDESVTIPVPVGHVTKYPANLRKKIEGLPWDFSALIAPTEATYTATRAYTTGALFIVDNILYKATASIASGGTITPGTNCTATTLAEVISAL